MALQDISHLNSLMLTALITDTSGLGASGTSRYSRCASRRMFTQFPSPLRRETACRSHDYQVTLRLPLHTFRGLGATPHGQVSLSDRFRQTLLTTSLEVVQAIYHLRSSPRGRNLDQSCALVHSIYDDDPQDDCTPTPVQSWARSPG